MSDAGRTLEGSRLFVSAPVRPESRSGRAVPMNREVRVAHVELSISGAFVPQARTPVESEFVSNIDRWAATVWQAVEACLILDVHNTVVAVSPAGSELLNLPKGADVVGTPLLGGDGMLRLVDFTASGSDLDLPELEKIPPILAISSERLARGLLRIQPPGDERHVTVDAIATPLVENGHVIASLTFFSAIRY